MKNVPLLLPDASYVELLTVELDQSLYLPVYASHISAGFPSPAEDYVELRVNISEFVTDNPTSTFFVRVHGDSMQDAHIVDGSILAVDRSLKPTSGDIIVAVINNEFTVKRLFLKGKSILLVPENRKYQALEITEEMNFQVWGKVVTVLHKL
ncbi:LexA family protein [Adhaeribacter aquaticus]|uniref:LexA family protein n=1 Tax=Adhaeribacter aquaticus TaxID=299567 RepID=UPI0003F4EBC8|nr:translesion error-prone DNA polymerase V autoproteolytic subunit [Adhaeribacter aquaticus]